MCGAISKVRSKDDLLEINIALSEFNQNIMHAHTNGVVLDILEYNSYMYMCTK